MAAHDDSQSFERQLDAIKNYFNPEEWQDFSPYEKKRFIKIKTNHDNLLAIGANPVMPTFMRQEIRTEYMTYTEADAKKRKLDHDSSKANARSEREVINCDARGEETEDDVEIIEEGFRQNSYRPRIKWENIQHNDSEPFIPDESDMENIDMLLEGVRMNLDHLRSLYKNPDADYCDAEEQPANERRAARYPKRNVPKVSYEEEQVSSEDDYIYCDDCGQPYEESCPQHGPLNFVQDKKAARGPRHPWNTCPDYLSVCRSGIRGAGLGVWTEKKLEKGYVFGPYKGKIVKSRKVAKDSGYAWEIRRSGKVLHYIDGRDIFISNFLRFVNCAVCEERQNLIAFQWHGQIWYRVYKEVKAYTELLVWYGDEFGEELGIFRDEERLPVKGVTKKCETGRGFAPSSSSTRNCNTSQKIVQRSEKASSLQSCRQNVSLSRIRKGCYSSQTLELGCGDSLASNVTDQFSAVKRAGNGRDEKKRAENGQNKHFRKTVTKCKLRIRPHSNYKAATIGNLQRHINVQEGRRCYPCQMCHYSATLAKNLQRHVAAVHEGRRPYKCQMCQYRAGTAQNLRIHVAAVHEERRPYKCQKCEYRATQADKLRLHVRAVHEGKRPYHCPHCNYRTTQSTNLLTHVRSVHEGQRPYHCPHCDYRSAYSTDLRKHVRSVHDGERPYHCPHCDYRATQSSHLRTHVISVHEKLKQFSCKQCHYKTSYHSDLRKHERAKHGGKKDANVSESHQKSHDLF